MVTTKKILATTALVTAAALVSASPGSADSRCYRHGPGEKRMVRKINRARGRAGAPHLGRDPQLSRVAGVHSRSMAQDNRLFHTPSELLAWRVTRWSMLGENVAYGSTVGGMHRRFMASPAHRGNILRSSYRNVGVAISRGHGRRWVTVIFESRRNPGTRMDMPRC